MSTGDPPVQANGEQGPQAEESTLESFIWSELGLGRQAAGFPQPDEGS